MAVVIPGKLRFFGPVVLAARKDEFFQDFEQLQRPREAMHLVTAHRTDLAAQAPVVIPYDLH